MIKVVVEDESHWLGGYDMSLLSTMRTAGAKH